MHLSSASEPTGPKSTDHYLVVHHDDRHDLLMLPETYTELENEVEKLYHFEPGQFFVETDDLNLCRGTRVRIPEAIWAKIARFIGNVFIVPRRAATAGQNPETSPDGEKSLPSEPEIRGEIALNQPFVNGSVLVVKVDHIDTDAPTTLSSQCNIHLLDGNRKSALSISFFPDSGWIFCKTSSNCEATFPCSLKEAFPLQSEHEIVIYKEESHFRILCDRQSIGTVKGDHRFFLTSATYDLGVQSPFIGPVSAAAYANLQLFTDRYPLYQSIISFTDNQALYRKILACDPAHAKQIFDELSTIRSREHSYSGVKWSSQNVTSRKEWVLHDWNMDEMSVFVIRMKNRQAVSPDSAFMAFDPASPLQSLNLKIQANNVTIGEYNENRHFVQQGRLQLPTLPLSDGEHSVAFVNQQGNMLVIFDFCKAIAFSNTTMMSRRPRRIYFDVPGEDSTVLDMDIYDF